MQRLPIRFAGRPELAGSRVKRRSVALLVGIALVGTHSARADTCAPTWEPFTVCSADGRRCLEVVPRRGPGADRTARAVLTSKELKARTRFALVNPDFPQSVLVPSSIPYLVTLDDGCSAGRSNKVVVIYRTDGSLVRQLALADLLTASDIEQFPRSVSSTHWRKDASIDEPARALVVKIPTCPGRSIGCDQQAELRIDLATGRRIGAFENLMPPARPPFEPALVSISVEDSTAWEDREAGVSPLPSCAPGVDREALPEPAPVSASALIERLTYGPLPSSPEIADKARIHGIVVVHLTVSPGGQVLCIRVLKGLPMGVDDAVVGALLNWRFAPEPGTTLRTVSAPVAVRFEEPGFPESGLPGGSR